MSEATETDFFPWILGGVFLVFAGVATTLALSAESSRSVAPPAILAPRPVADPSNRVAETPPATVSSIAKSAPIPVVSATPPPLPEGQVWQCVIDGQRTFSDAPCGAGASIRQLNPINRMAPTQVPSRAYYPSPQAVTQFPADEPGYSETSDPGYETDLVYVRGDVHRRGHLPRHRPLHHGHGATH